MYNQQKNPWRKKNLCLLLVLFFTIGLTACAVDYQDSTVPGSGTTCKPTDAQVSSFHSIYTGSQGPLMNCGGSSCHGPSGSSGGRYRLTASSSLTTAATQKDNYCFHYDLFPDNTLIELPTSASHAGGQQTESNVQAFADWVRNRYQ